MDSEIFEDDDLEVTSPVTNEIENFYREIIRAELALMRTRRFDYQTFRDFAQGARWGVTRLLKILGHEQWAENVLVEELSLEQDKTSSKSVAKHLGRVVIPGNRLTARF